MAALKKESREKAALGVFAGLIAICLAAVICYIVFSHSWNAAATSIDDSIGSMDGYKTILFDGVERPPQVTSDKSEETEGAEETQDAEETEDTQETEVVQEAQDFEETESAQDAEETESAQDVEGGLLFSGEDTQKSTVAISVKEVKDDYEKEGAQVLVLDLGNLGYYERGAILERADEFYGILSIQDSTSADTIEERLAWLAKCEVDYVIVLTTDLELIPEGTDIDIAISTKDEDQLTISKTIDGVYCVKAPDEGSVGAVIISPSNVVSSKVIKEL